MNRARQDAITTEIMEIVGGAEALRSGSGDDATHLAEHRRAPTPTRPPDARRSRSNA